MQPNSDAGPRIRLNRDRVVRSALALADAGGIEALSMRKLAGSLRVEAMSLYNHVANKEDLLDGMVDIVFGEIGLPPGGIGWKTAMRQRAISALAVLERHPWATSLMESRTNPGPATLEHHDAVIRSLRMDGFSLELAAHAYLRARQLRLWLRAAAASGAAGHPGTGGGGRGTPPPAAAGGQVPPSRRAHGGARAEARLRLRRRVRVRARPDPRWTRASPRSRVTRPLPAGG